MNTEETKQLTEEEIEEAWQQLWELACSEIPYGSSKVNYEDFLLFGKKKFDLKIKESYQE